MRTTGLVLLLSLLAGGNTVAAAPPLTPEGWGDLRVGMSEAEAVRRFGLVLAPDDGVNSDACRETPVPGVPGLFVMTEEGEVTRLTLYGESPIRTDRNLTIGSPAAEVRRAYGAAIRAERHVYEDPPARYLTYRPGRKGLGIRYEIASDGRVATIHAGLSINYVEGCL